MIRTLVFISALSASALVAAPEKAPKPATNTTCPVAGDKVTAKSGKVVVRGREYYICCPACGPKLQADPDKYLNKDGTPKNAKR
jgi:YHS domain-containing protein